MFSDPPPASQSIFEETTSSSSSGSSSVDDVEATLNELGLNDDNDGTHIDQQNTIGSGDDEAKKNTEKQTEDEDIFAEL